MTVRAAIRARRLQARQLRADLASHHVAERQDRWLRGSSSPRRELRPGGASPGPRAQLGIDLPRPPVHPLGPEQQRHRTRSAPVAPASTFRQNRAVPHSTSPSRGVAGRLRTESGSAVLLIVVTVFAFLWANSPLSSSYVELWHQSVGIDVGPFGLHLDLHHWINDGLMVVFFFVVGLEVRQEFAYGALRDSSRARLAAIAGFTGVALPALVYVLVVGASGGEGLRGWGAVVGTDTAFMLGALAIVGPRLSGQLRVFLLTLTVVDDFLAVSIIGVFYSDEIRPVPLLVALGCLVALWLVGRSRQWSAAPYVGIVIVLWVATLSSGIHASLTGMIAGLLIPAYPTQRHEVVAARQLFRDFWQSPSASSARAVGRGLSKGVSVNERLHDYLRLPTALLVVPIFALANAGVDLGGGVVADSLSSPVTWGVIAGLVLGKLLGIGIATLLAVRMGAGRLPEGVGMGSVFGGQHFRASVSPCRCWSSASLSTPPRIWGARRRWACSWRWCSPLFWAGRSSRSRPVGGERRRRISR